MKPIVQPYWKLEEELKKKVDISAIHVALKRMEDKVFVKSRLGGITEDRGGRRKKFYVITGSWEENAG